MRILNGTYAPRGTRAVMSTWRDTAGNLLAIPRVLHPPIHPPAGVHTVKYWLVNCAGRSRRRKARVVVERRKRGRRKFHVRVGNLNKQTVRARFKNGLVSRKRNGRTKFYAQPPSASPSLRDSDVASTSRAISSTYVTFAPQ